MEDWNITVQGDAEGGWIVSVHDGDRLAAYSPDAKNAAEARAMAHDSHAMEYHMPVLPEHEPEVDPDAKIDPALSPEFLSTTEALATVGIVRPAGAAG